MMKCKPNIKKTFFCMRAFTLIELLAVVTIIIIITGFLIKVPPMMEQKAKIAKTEYLLKNIADGIKSFEEDFDTLPPTTAHLLSIIKLKEFTTSKNLKIGSAEPYLINVPEIYYGNFESGNFHCPLFNPYDTSIPHAHNILPKDVDASIGGTNPPFGWKKTCKDCIGGTCTETLVKTSIIAESGFIAGSYVTPEIQVCADAFESIIFYLPDLTNNTFILISQGPDKKSSISMADYFKYIYDGTSISYTPNSTTDKDNIIYK